MGSSFLMGGGNTIIRNRGNTRRPKWGLFEQKRRKKLGRNIRKAKNNHKRREHKRVLGGGPSPGKKRKKSTRGGSGGHGRTKRGGGRSGVFPQENLPESAGKINNATETKKKRNKPGRVFFRKKRNSLDCICKRSCRSVHAREKSS